MSDNIQTNTTGRLTPCLQKRIDKTTYLVEVHFSSTSTQSVEDKVRRVIHHDLECGKQGKSGKVTKTMKSDKPARGKWQRGNPHCMKFPLRQKKHFLKMLRKVAGKS